MTDWLENERVIGWLLTTNFAPVASEVACGKDDLNELLSIVAEEAVKEFLAFDQTYQFQLSQDADYEAPIKIEPTIVGGSLFLLVTWETGPGVLPVTEASHLSMSDERKHKYEEEES